MILETVRALLSWSLIFPALFLLGRFFRRWIHVKDIILQGIIYCSLGMAILSNCIILLSWIHLLNPISIWCLLGAIILVGIRSLNDFWIWIKSLGSSLLWEKSFVNKIFLLIFIISTLGLLSGVFSPEIGGDALCYHLNLPKIFLETGSAAPLFYDLNSYFPMLMNYLYLIGLATGGVFSAKFFHFLTFLLLFFALKRTIELETKNQLVAFFSALVFWLTPTFFNLASTTYVDIGLSLYSFLSVWMLVQAFRNQDNATFFMSAVFLGCAVGAKYLAILSIVALVGVLLFQMISRREFKKIPQQFLIWSFGILIGGGWWFLRNWIQEGNPLFPYMASFFGTKPLPDQSFDLLGIGTSPIHFIASLFNLFLFPKAFGQVSESIGIGYGLYYPFILLAPIVKKESRIYFLFSFLFLVLWFVFGQATRYIMPLLPFLLLVGAFGIVWLFRKLRPFFKTSLSCLGILVLLVYLAGGLYHYRYAYLVSAGIWTPDEYLLKLERTMPVATWMNQNLPENASVLVENESRLFYMNRPLLRDLFFRHRRDDFKNVKDVSSYYQFLKSNGVTHILLTDPMDSKGEVSSEDILRRFAKSKHSKLLYEGASENIREPRFYYRLYQLNS